MPGKFKGYADNLTRERVEKAARMYHSNIDAAVALRCTPASFGRACKKHGVKTPKQRRRGQKPVSG